MTVEEFVKTLRIAYEEMLSDEDAKLAREFVREAADLIERQEDALEKAEKALTPFSCEAEKYDPDDGDSLHVIWGEQRLKIGNIREARSALTTIKAARGEKK